MIMKVLKGSELPVKKDFFKRDLFADFFDEFFTPNLMQQTSFKVPAVDITEEKDKYLVKADLPGMKQEEVKVEIDNNVLVISGERKNEREEKDESKHYHYYERSYGSFERRFVLPGDIDAEKIDAKYDNGVLEIEIPKIEGKKPKEIKIK
jgi:HSP20 family protein